MNGCLVADNWKEMTVMQVKYRKRSTIPDSFVMLPHQVIDYIHVVII